MLLGFLEKIIIDPLARSVSEKENLFLYPLTNVIAFPSVVYKFPFLNSLSTQHIAVVAFKHPFVSHIITHQQQLEIFLQLGKMDHSFS